MEYAFYILQNSRPTQLPGRDDNKDKPVDRETAKYIAGICCDPQSIIMKQETVTATADLFVFLCMNNHAKDDILKTMSHADQKMMAAEVLAKTAPNAGGRHYDIESLKKMDSVSLALFAWYPNLFAANQAEKDLNTVAEQLAAVKDDDKDADKTRSTLRGQHDHLYKRLRTLLKDTLPNVDECKKDIIFDERSAETDYDKQQTSFDKLSSDLKKLEEKNKASPNHEKIPDLLAPVTQLAEARSTLDAEVDTALEYVSKLTAAANNKPAAAASTAQQQQHVDPTTTAAATAEGTTATAENADEKEQQQQQQVIAMPGLITEYQSNWQAKIAAWKTKLAECEKLAAVFSGNPAFQEMMDAEDRTKLVDFANLKSSIQKCEQLSADLDRAVEESKSTEEAFTAEYGIFDRERGLMLQWCRQQRTNLDAIVDPDELQEFCASLLANHSVMEQNVSGLLEMAEPPKLLPRLEVQKALSELSEVWLHLHVSALERLQRELIEIHDTSRLEDEVRAFAPYSQKANTFLQDFQKLLTAPADAHSRLLMQPMVAAVEELLQDSTEHDKLSGQLHEFVNSMEGLRENYLNFRKAVLSRVTFLAGTTPTISASLRRRDEYTRRMNALSEWVAAKSRGEHWSAVRQRLDKLQNMIDEEVDILKKEAEDEEEKQKQTAAENAKAAAAQQQQQQQQAASSAAAAAEPEDKPDPNAQQEDEDDIIEH